MEKTEKIAGVTFNGSVTFNGPMFDIHDNRQVTIVRQDSAPVGNGETAVQAEGEGQDLMSKLKPMFFGNEDEARTFLQSVRGMKPTQVTALVNQLMMQRKLSEMSKRRDLWKLLHDSGLYSKSESNWNMQVK